MKDCSALTQGRASRQEVKSFRKKGLLFFIEGSHGIDWYRGVPVSSQWLSSDWKEMGVIKEGKDATGKCSRRGSNFSGQVEFLQVYWFSFWNTIWKASLKFVSENIFKQGCGKDMFMVDTVSFPSLWYLFGEYVYILLSAGIYQAKTPLGMGDLFFCTIMFWKTFRLQEVFGIRAHDFKINNSNYRALL